MSFERDEVRSTPFFTYIRVITHSVITFTTGNDHVRHTLPSNAAHRHLRRAAPSPTRHRARDGGPRVAETLRLVRRPRARRNCRVLRDAWLPTRACLRAGG